MSPIKLSVFTTCYNQELFIREAIESVMNQSVLPYEYIICDDCSKDNTWEIVLEYQNKYPEIIKAYRNDHNIGLYSNFNSSQLLVTGNLITCVSGDDLILPGSFEEIIRTVEKEKLDTEEDSFMIISNIVNLFENGNKTYYSNYRYRNQRLFSLRLRYILDERFAFVSKKSFQKTGSFKTDLGLHADFLWGFERIINTDKFIFMDQYHHVYRVGVGAASKASSMESIQSFQMALDGIYEKYRTYFNRKDYLFYQYISSKNRYLLNKSFTNYLNLFVLLIRNFNNFGNIKKILKGISIMVIPQNIKKWLLNFRFFKLLSK